MSLRDLMHLLRVKHYLKNGLILAPLVFSGRLLDLSLVGRGVLAIVAFSFASSAIYIINDIRDAKNDKKHPTKRHRPIAAGKVKIAHALVVAGFLLVIALAITYKLSGVSLVGGGYLLAYILINILYSLGLKRIPVIDVAILASGFILRVLYGAAVVDVEVSKWLYLTIFALSFYMGLGKRRNEILLNGSSTRAVNKHYNVDFLDKNMYVSLGLAVVYYSLWAIEPMHHSSVMVWTVPLFAMVLMAYSLDVEKSDSEGDPINVLTRNKGLLGAVFLYLTTVMCLIYVQL